MKFAIYDTDNYLGDDYGSTPEAALGALAARVPSYMQHDRIYAVIPLWTSGHPVNCDGPMIFQWKEIVSCGPVAVK